MYKLITAPSGWIERHDDSLLNRFLVNHAQQVRLTDSPLSNPTMFLRASDAIGFDNRSSHIVFCQPKSVLTQEDEFPSCVRGKSNRFAHFMSVAPSEDGVKNRGYDDAAIHAPHN